MGVQFSHCKLSWSYSRFMGLRRKLAEAIGINLVEMSGFGGDRPWGPVRDPIQPLLTHSDCDGELSPQDCRTVSARLRELVNTWENPRCALLLAEAMETAAAVNQPLLFN